MIWARAAPGIGWSIKHLVCNARQYRTEQHILTAKYLLSLDLLVALTLLK